MFELLERDRRFLNLFNDADIKKYKTLFFIDGEESLSNCWLHFSAHGTLDRGEIFAFLSSLYYLIEFFETEYQLEKSEYEFHILVEESDDFIYFTIQSYYLIHIISENSLLFNEFENRQKDSIVTFRVSVLSEQDSVVGATSKRDLTVHNFIPKGELIQLQDLSSQLTLDLLEILEFGFSRENISDFILTLFKFSKIIKNYKQIESISDEVEDFIFLLKTHTVEATNLDIENLSYFENFANHLNLWLKKSFFSGIESIEAYNNKINGDIQNIKSILVPKERDLEEELL